MLLSVAVLLIYGGRLLWQQYGQTNLFGRRSQKIMGVPLVEEPVFLEGKERVRAQENPGVYFQETILPYNAQDNILYLSQSLEEERWIGKLSPAEGASLYAACDVCWEDKEAAIKEGHAFTLWLVLEDCYYEFSLVISGLPVISIGTERMEVQDPGIYEEDPDKFLFDSEDLYYGDIRVFDPGVGSSRYEIAECRVVYHFKGASTAGLAKKAYALSLQDTAGKKLNLSLLGMRYDNSWKLNALVIDKNRIREMTAAQIWEQLAAANTTVNETGPRMEYAELVVDNDYKGLYCLVEPVDEKKLELDSNDVLYKMISWDAPDDDSIQYSIDRGWRIQSAVRIRYPEVITDYEKVWYPIRDYQAKCINRWEGYEKIPQLVYPENIYDIYMFLMTVCGNDNYYKNMYYGADVKADGSYMMRVVPWDLDYTFGNEYITDGELGVRYAGNIAVEYKEISTDLLMEYAPDTVAELLVERWIAYRQDFLSTEAIQGLMRENTNYLMDSGVMARENNRWPQYSMDTDIDYLLDFQARRMEWLDEYFSGLVQ